MKYWLTINRNEINTTKFKNYTGHELKNINFNTLEGEKILEIYTLKRYEDFVELLNTENKYEQLLTLDSQDQAFVFVAALKTGKIIFDDDLNYKEDLFGINELSMLNRYEKLKTDKISFSPIVEFLNKKYPKYVNTLLSTYGILLTHKNESEKYFIESIQKADEILKEYKLYSNDIILDAERIGRITILVYLKGEKKTRELIDKMDLPENIKGNKFLFFKSKLRKAIELFSKVFEEFDKMIFEESAPLFEKANIPLTEETIKKMEKNKKMKTCLLHLTGKIIEATESKEGVFNDPQNSYWLRWDMANWVISLAETTNITEEELKKEIDYIMKKLTNYSLFSEAFSAMSKHFEELYKAHSNN
ncbi:hypothetical protein KO317_02345 [Candidatus Micrarchaeota archaeon]|nr:hypothetical protein [Candidatus Micrarchaeota archaeon]